MQVYLLSLIVMSACTIGYAMEWDGISQTSQNSSEASRLVGEAENVLEDMQRELRIKVLTREGYDAFVANKKNQAIDFAYKAKDLIKDAEDVDLTEEIVKETKRTLNRIAVIEQKVNRK